MDQPSTSNRPTGQVGEATKQRRRLKFITFGKTAVSFLDVLVTTTTDQAVELSKRADGRKYIVKTDGRGAIDIEYEANDTYTIALFNQSRWVTSVYVNAEDLNVGNVSRAAAQKVTTMHVTKNNERKVHATFKLTNLSDGLLKRLDVRGHGATWFSVFSHHSNLLMVRPNGDWVSEKMTYYTDQLVTKAINNYRRSNGNEILPSMDTAVMQRRRSSAPMSVQEKASQTADQEGQHERERQLLNDERMYEQRAYLLQQNYRHLREKKSAYEKDLAECRLLEGKLARLRDEEQFYAHRKNELAREITAIGQAGHELVARKQRLQEEEEQFQIEQQEFEKVKDRVAQEKIASATQSSDRYTQTERSLWAPRMNTRPMAQRIAEMPKLVPNGREIRVFTRKNSV